MLLHKVAIFCQNCYMTEFTVTDVYAIGLPIIIAMMMLEALISQHQNKKYYKNKDTLCTSGLVAGNILVSLAIKGATLALHFYLYQFRVFDITNMIPVWLLWILTFVFIDLVFYIYHRCSHNIRFLWAIHMCHHSSMEMNFAVSLRQAWLGPVSKIPFFAILPSIGFSLTDYSKGADFSASNVIVQTIVKEALKNKIEKGICLNVNIPNVPLEKIKGIKTCRQGKAFWDDTFDKRVDPLGKEYYWLTGSFLNHEQSSETDVFLLQNNYVTIVPVQFDMTAYDQIDNIKKWKLNL